MVAGKAAMTVTAGSDVKKFVKKVGVAQGRRDGDAEVGQRARTRASSARPRRPSGITAWTKHPQEAADFIMFMHTPERLAAWFKATGAFPADDRFDTS